MYWSIGGAPEAVIAACAIKAMGGYLQCREVESEEKYEPDDKAPGCPRPYHYTVWNSVGPLLEIEDLASGPVMFAATGITDGQLLKGLRYTNRGPITHSIAMRSESGTIRKLTTEHGN